MFLVTLLKIVIRSYSRASMVTPRIIATELRKKRIEKAKGRSNTILNSAELQVIGSNCASFLPSLIVNSEGNSYLFNCNEGFQRLSYANKIKLLNLENAFVTNTDWTNVSGAFGLSLTLQDVGSPSFTLRGAEGIDEFFQATKTFMTFNSGIRTDTLTHHAGVYKDSGIEVVPVALDETSTQEFESRIKRGKNETKLVMYVCSLPDLPGRLNAQKCRELKVPIGPMLALLKSGEDVTLPDGRIIKSSEVCGPKDKGFFFIIVEVPTINHIDLITNNLRLREIIEQKQTEDRHVELVVHFSPDQVIKHPRYKDWMDSFPESCKHWLLNSGESDWINFAESYRLMYLYQKIDKEIFPCLYLSENAKKTIEEELAQNTPSDDVTKIEADTELRPVAKGDLREMNKITRAEAFDKIIVRPCRVIEGVQKRYAIDSQYRIAKLIPLFEERLKRHQELLSLMPETYEFEPELIFFGTGSAIPSKLRNTSCILLNLKVPRDVSVMLDCGEDSYGQMVRYYGPEKVKEVLKQLKMIYVSHHHADHHIGLIRIIKARREVVSEPMILLIPPGIDYLLDYHNKNYEDLSECYTIFATKALKPATGVGGSPGSTSLRLDLLKELDGVLKNFSIVGVDHCINSCAAVFEFNICRPGLKTFRLAYSGDARPSEKFIEAGQDCDLLIHEATFDHRAIEDAIQKKHSTTHEAIDVGRKMNAKFTILTHFSQRFSKIPYFTNQFDDKVGFAFDNLTLRCPSHFPRLPIMKDLLQVLYDESLYEVDFRYQKKEMRQKAFKQIEESETRN